MAETLTVELHNRTQAGQVLTESELRSILQGTNHMVKNAMHGAFWPELEEACRAIEQGRRAAGSELNAAYFADQVHYLQAAEREVSMPSLFDLEDLKEAA